MSDELNGICVLVTRPSHQADNLVKLIESHGGEALCFPALEIEANADREAVLATIGDITDYDIAIFISSNAVSHGVQYLPVDGKRPLLAAIGPSTARALFDAGFRSDIKATRGFTSEALLREPALKDVAGKKLIIFRGSGGRALLGRELEQRGALVTYAEVYRRDRPEVLDPEIESRLTAGTIDVVTATSAETLFNLYELAEEPGVTELTRTQLVTISERVVNRAAALEFEHPALLAKGPDDQSLVEAILEWRHATSHTDFATGTMMTDPSKHELDESTDDKQEPPIEAAGGNRGTSDGEQDETSTAEPGIEADDEGAIIEAAESEQLIAPAPAPVKRGGGALSLLAILLSLAALAASGYLWWQQQQAGSNTARLQAAAGQALAETKTEIATLGGRLNTNLAQVSGLNAGRGRVESNIADLRSSVETLTARVQGAEQSIDAVRGVSASARNNWVRAEAEYFLQAANSRLQLARDPDAALAALEAADDRLKSLGDPTLFRVRQELAGEIVALKAVPRPDMEGIALTLSSLATRVEQLPLVNASPDSYQAVVDTDQIEGESAMDRAVATLGKVVTSIVSIKRTDEEAKPLMSRDEEFFLKRNLELQLQTARLALLRGEPANFTDSLRTARNWLQTHFETEAAAVQSVIGTLTELEKKDISPRLPNISGSLRLLRLAAPTDTTSPRTDTAAPRTEIAAPPTEPAAATTVTTTAPAGTAVTTTVTTAAPADTGATTTATPTAPAGTAPIDNGPVDTDTSPPPDGADSVDDSVPDTAIDNGETA